MRSCINVDLFLPTIKRKCERYDDLPRRAARLKEMAHGFHIE